MIRLTESLGNKHISKGLQLYTIGYAVLKLLSTNFKKEEKDIC